MRRAEGRAKREPVRAKPQEKSIRIFRLHSTLSQRERVDLPNFQFVHTFEAAFGFVLALLLLRRSTRCAGNRSVQAQEQSRSIG